MSFEDEDRWCTVCGKDAAHEAAERGSVVMSKTIKAGDKLWFVPNERHHGNPREIVVGKVGRKWATTDDRFRIDVETLMADGEGHSSPGRCYRDRELYEKAKSADNAWSRLQRFARENNRRPDGLTQDAIEQALKLIGALV